MLSLLLTFVASEAFNGKHVFSTSMLDKQRAQVYKFKKQCLGGQSEPKET